jgi:hypothetical protein
MWEFYFIFSKKPRPRPKTEPAPSTSNSNRFGFTSPFDWAGGGGGGGITFHAGLMPFPGFGIGWQIPLGGSSTAVPAANGHTQTFEQQDERAGIFMNRILLMLSILVVRPSSFPLVSLYLLHLTYACSFAVSLFIG